MAGEKIAFITGGTGFVGSHLAEELLRRDFAEVRCLIRTDRKWLRGLNIVPIQGSLGDRAALENAVSGVTHVYHVAGQTRARDEQVLIDSNVTGTIKLLEAVERAAERIEHVLITSSLAAVGECDDAIATEQSPLRPISAYGRSKATMERQILDIENSTELTTNWSRRLPISIVRPPAVYGPREADIFAFFKTVDGGICPVVGSGRKPELSLVHVRDLVRGMADLAESSPASGEVYFIGSEEYYSWSAIQAATVAALGRKVVTLRIPKGLVPAIGAASEAWGFVTRSYPPLNREKASEILKACKLCSVEKAMRAFGYRQHVDLESGVAETIEWYRREGWLKPRS